MKVIRDEKYAKKIRQKIIDAHLLDQREATPGKWHVSDLLFPRYGYFCRVDGHVPTDEEVGFFMTGEAYHRFIQDVLGKEMAEQQGEYLNIIGTCDWLDKDVTEIKTSRKWTVPKEPEDHYITQAGYYCVIFKRKRARILVIYPVAGRKWGGSQSSTVEIAAWTVEFSSADLEQIAQELEEIGGLLDKALKAKKHNGLPLCLLWKCGREWKKELKLCPFYNICKPKNRYPEKKLLELIR
jgi:hypothetical protein